MVSNDSGILDESHRQRIATVTLISKHDRYDANVYGYSLTLMENVPTSLTLTWNIQTTSGNYSVPIRLLQMWVTGITLLPPTRQAQDWYYTWTGRWGKPA